MYREKKFVTNLGVMIAAPRSGSGKTLITCALLKALKDRGMKVRSFKCGPDYIDPMFHKKILDIPSRNLDLFFLNEDGVRELVNNDDDYDISVVEGVMGLYDGILGGERASSYHLAKTLNVPIILVIDAKGMSNSILAEIAGFLAFDEEKLIKGVILNRISENLYNKLSPMIEEKFNIAVLGYFPVSKDINIESRHLGLKLPYEYDNLAEMTKRAARLLGNGVSIDRLIDIARLNNSMTLARSCVRKESEKKVKIAVAMDEAFCFYYDDNLRLLEEAGGELYYFSPIRDKGLPDDISGIILGGGYPENYLEALQDNKDMLAIINNLINKGMPSLAECGGFMYLHEAIYDKTGTRYEMAGLVKGVCKYKEKLVRFGYVEIEALDNSFSEEPLRIKGHEFHYYDSDNNGEACVAKKPSSGKSHTCMHVADNHIWGFPHLYYPSCPKLAYSFINKCEQFATSSVGKQIAR